MKLACVLVSPLGSHVSGVASPPGLRWILRQVDARMPLVFTVNTARFSFAAHLRSCSGFRLPRHSSARSAIPGQVLEEIWNRITSVQPELPQVWVLGLGIAALVLTWTPTGYRVARHLATLLHEAGHAIIGIMVGRKLRGVRLHSDTSGLTVSRGKPTGPGMVATLLAGYPAPAVVGLAGAWLVSTGYAAGMLWSLVVLCAALLLFIRNFYGLWVVLVTGVGVTILSWTAPPTVLSIVAYFMVWSMLLIAPRAIVDLQRSRQRHRGRTGSDADQLATLTRLPAGLWVALFWLSSLVCLIAGGWLLLRTGT